VNMEKISIKIASLALSAFVLQSAANAASLVLFDSEIRVAPIGDDANHNRMNSDFPTIQLAAADSENEIPEFTEEYLSNEANIAAGKEIWFEQCTHCHGMKAYPGKAPKLKPKKYKPEFVFYRVSEGFNKMPSWKDVYSQEEIKQIVAYVKSKSFSP
jgi:mono/diheme cytochrome c family protein